MAQVDCGKCDGRGRLDWCGHIENGRCYACQGTGRVRVQAKTVQDRAAETAAYSMHTVAEALRDGRQDRAEFYARSVAGELFKAGTAHARSILSRRYYDSMDNLLPLDVCRKAARLVIKIGKEMQK